MQSSYYSLIGPSENLGLENPASWIKGLGTQIVVVAVESRTAHQKEGNTSLPYHTRGYT